MLTMERMADEQSRCKYVLTTDIYLTRSLSFVYPKHSILPPLFDSIMLSYVESGIIKHLQTKDLPEAVICPLDLGSKERQLRNPDLITTYIVVVSGFTVACFVLLGERLMRRVCASKIGDQLQQNFPQGGFIGQSSKLRKARPDTKKGMFNGTEYYMYKNEQGQKRMIPTRTPSAALFHRWNSFL
uniref:Uncharacterized protein n=2 Tax=Cacopsylla melanoneura TaxID=428564 RepID=A0A8D9BDS8_9HEMI